MKRSSHGCRIPWRLRQLLWTTLEDIAVTLSQVAKKDDDILISKEVFDAGLEKLNASLKQHNESIKSLRQQLQELAKEHKSTKGEVQKLDWRGLAVL